MGKRNGLSKRLIAEEGRGGLTPTDRLGLGSRLRNLEVNASLGALRDRDSLHDRISAVEEHSYINPRWSNLIAGWHLDEESDGSVAVPRADVLGTYTLTDVGTTPSGTGVINNGASFTRANGERLTVNDGSGIQYGGALTVVGFAKLISPANYPMLVTRANRTLGTREWEIFWSANNLFGQLNGLGAFSRNVAWPVGGAFHFFCLRLSGPATALNLKISVDAGTPGEGTFNVGTLNNSADGIVRLSGYGSGTDANGWLNGVEDGVFIFGEAKNDAWVTDFYNAGAGRAYPN